MCHTLENEAGTGFTVAGCWIHARRPFADVIKSMGQDKAAGTLAYEAYVQIQNIYHTDNALKKLPPSDRKKKRKKLVKPLVDAFFDWAEPMPVRSSTASSRQLRPTILIYTNTSNICLRRFRSTWTRRY